VSGLLAGKVWLSNLSRELKPLAATLADIANDDGTSIYPSVAYVAWRLGCTERSVQLGLAALLNLGALKLVANPTGGRGLTREYRLIESNLPSRPPWSTYRKGENFSPFPASDSGQKGAIHDEKGCNPQHKRVKPASPDPSLSVSESSGSAPSSPAVDLREQPNSNPRNGADQQSGKDFSKALKRLAWKKDLGHAKRSAGNPQLKHLEAGIFRHHVRSAYFDGRGDGHEKAFGYALDQAALSLTTNRAVELRWIRVEELRSAAWAKLRPYVGAFAGIADYSRRQNQVVGAIVRVVAEAALTLQTASESSHANQPREAVEVQPVAAG